MLFILIFRPSEAEVEVAAIHSEGEDEDYSQRKSFTEFLQLQTEQGKTLAMLANIFMLGCKLG